jgi:hypothetical protein
LPESKGLWTSTLLVTGALAWAKALPPTVVMRINNVALAATLRVSEEALLLAVDRAFKIASPCVRTCFAQTDREPRLFMRRTGFRKRLAPGKARAGREAYAKCCCQIADVV